MLFNFNRDKDNKSSISRDIRWASSSIILRKLPLIVSSIFKSFFIVSTKPNRLVRGERNS